jgi:hypothetical protein
MTYEVDESVRQEMGEIIKWALEEMKDYVVVDMDDNILGSAFIGTVFSLSPSGKFWTWWACSNVDEEEMEADRDYWEAFEELAYESGVFIFNGEGDPCDVFIGMCFDEAMFKLKTGDVIGPASVRGYEWEGINRMITLRVKDNDGRHPYSEITFCEDEIETISVEEEFNGDG